MVLDIDIYRTANILVREHGQDAPIHAAMRADELLDKSDMEGCAVFKQVLQAVDEMQRAGREPDKRCPSCSGPAVRLLWILP